MGVTGESQIIPRKKHQGTEEMPREKKNNDAGFGRGLMEANLAKYRRGRQKFRAQ